MTTIGEVLEKLRGDKGWSLAHAAKAIGCSPSRLSELEKNLSRTTLKPTSPSAEMLIKIARAYEVQLPWLLEVANLSPASPDDRQESRLIASYRKLSATNRDLALALVLTMEAKERDGTYGTSGESEP